MPVPWSATLRAMVPRLASALMVTGEPGAEYFAAFSNRLQITFARKPGSAHFEPGGHEAFDGMLLIDPNAAFTCMPYQVLHFDCSKVHMHLLRIELSHLDSFGDEPVQAVTFLVDDREQLMGFLRPYFARQESFRLQKFAAQAEEHFQFALS